MASLRGSREGLNTRAPDTTGPRIYHYPTKFRRNVATLDSLKYTHNSDSTVTQAPTPTEELPRTELLSANSPVQQSGVQYAYAPNTRTPRNLPLPEVVPTRENKQKDRDTVDLLNKRNLIYAAIALAVVAWLYGLIYISSPSQPPIAPPIPPASAGDQEELKTYIRNLVEYYSQEDKIRTQAELDKYANTQKVELDKRTKAIQGDIDSISSTLKQLSTGQKDNEASGNEKVSNLQDDIKRLTDRIAELQKQQITLTEVRRITQEITSDVKQVTPEQLETLRDDIYTRISQQAATTAPSEGTSAPSVPTYDIADEVRKQLRTLSNDLTTKVNADLDEKVQSADKKWKASLEEQLASEKIKLEAQLADKLKEEVAKTQGNVDDKLKEQQSKIQSEIEEKVKADRAQLASELEEKISAEEKRNQVEVEAINQAIAALRARKEITSESVVAEISPKIHDIVRELVKESLSTSTPQQPTTAQPIDEAQINRLVDQIVQDLKQKVEKVSEKLDTVAGDVDTVKQRPAAQPGLAAKDIEVLVDRMISDKFKALSGGAAGESASGVQLEIVRRDILTEVKKMFEDLEADKIAKIDWALASIGAQIVHSRTSDTYSLSPDGVFSSFYSMIAGPASGLPPTAVLTRDMTPGNCWAFKGPKGHIAIKLPVDNSTLTITHVTIDHIPITIAPNIESAPKDFAVWGLTNETAVRTRMGSFTYDINANVVAQTFELEVPAAFPIVMVEILSNNGHKEYTCVYRIRVHGDKSN